MPLTAAVRLAAIGVLLCVLAVAGQLLHDYYLLRPWLYHPVVFGILAAAAFTAACAVGIRRPAFRWAGTILFALAGAGVCGLAWFASVFGQGLAESSRQPSPDGSAELIVYQGHNWIDPFWDLRVQVKNGMLSREHDLGCVNGDFVAPTKIEWIGQQTVRVQLSSGETIDIHLDERGHPDRKVQGGC